MVSGRRGAGGLERKRVPAAPHPAPAALLRGLYPPMLATLATVAPTPGGDWVYELKYDGFRALAALSGGQGALWSRNQLDLAPRFPGIASALRRLVVGEAVLDGEVVALDDRGVPRFQLLQAGERPLIYFAFDLLWLDGADLRQRPLEARRALLRRLLADGPPELQVSLEVSGDPARFLAQAARRGFEGLVAKRRGSLYENRRTKRWLKLKARHEQALAIVGYQPSTAAAREVGSLLLAYAKGGELVFAGKVGSGFTAKVRAALFQALLPARVAAPSAIDSPRSPGLKQAVWVAPRLVAQVAFSDWTADGRLRQASFLGLRDDKAPLEATRD